MLRKLRCVHWGVGALAVILTGEGTGRAWAAISTYTSTYTNSATSVYFDQAPDQLKDYSGAALTSSHSGTHTLSFGNGSGGATNKVVTDDVYSKAALSDGTLKVRAALGFGANTFQSGSAIPLGHANGNASALAEFGDTFTTYSGNHPYIFQSGDQVTFKFGVTGTQNIPGGLAIPASYDPGQPRNLIYSALNVYAMKPGTFDLLQQANDFDYNSYADPNEADAAITAIYAQIDSNILARNYWYFGNYVAPFTVDADHLLAVNASTPTNVEFSFHPDGAFEWYAFLDNTIQLDASMQNVSAALDFSHSIVTTYEGPAGTTTVSASGLFPDTVPVPEPATLGALLVCGAALLMRRR